MRTTIEFVPQREHVVFPLEWSVGKCHIGQQSLFT